jgi:hypothetical protein
MRGGLFLGDRMFFIKAYLAEVIVQAKGILTPLIRPAYPREGGELKRFGNPPLKTLKSKGSNYKTLEREVVGAGELEARLSVT